MIALDGVSYTTSDKSYDHTVSKIGTLRRTATGDWERLETGVFGNRYKIVVLCVPTDIQNLWASFSKAGSNNRLDFIDEEGMRWDPTAGTDEPDHYYGTGVYFTHMSNPRAVTSGIGWSPYNKFLVEITLEAKSKAPLWSAIRTESDLDLLTENDLPIY